MTDNERTFERIASLVKPRVRPVKLEPVVEPKVKPGYARCVHGLRKWPQPGKKHCGPCWAKYMLFRWHEREKAKRRGDGQ